MGKFIVDEMRVKTMRERLGKASKLIESDQYLPMFRNRQIQFKNEFEFATDYYLKHRTDNGVNRRCFAKMWGRSKLAETLQTIRAMMERVKAVVREAAIAAKKLADDTRLQAEFNPTGRDRYEKMRLSQLRI